MKTNQKELLKNYEDLKLKEKSIKAQLDEIKGDVLEVILENPKVATERGTFTLSKKESYTYPEELIEKAKALKEEQKEAVQTGNVEVKVLEYVTYKANKAE